MAKTVGGVGTLATLLSVDFVWCLLDHTANTDRDGQKGSEKDPMC